MSHADTKRRLELMRKGELLFGPTVTDADRNDPDFDGFCSVPFTRAGFKPLRVLATKFTRARRLMSACEIHDL